MSMNITAIVEALVAAGASPEMILAAVRSAEGQKDAAIAQRDAEIEAGKEKSRERWRRWKSAKPNVSKRLQTTANVSQQLAGAEDKTLTSVIEPQEKKEGKVRACRLPTDFAPDVSWAISQGLSLSQADTEAAKFRDYWSSKGSNATKTDWPATWRNWVRSAVERTPQNRAPPASQQAPSMSDLLVAIRDTPHENQPEPPEDRSGLRTAIPHLRAVGAG